MNSNTSGQTIGANQEQVHESHEGREGYSETTGQQADKKWVQLPDGLSTWLNKRMEFSVPLWAVAGAGVVLAFLVFD